MLIVLFLTSLLTLTSAFGKIQTGDLVTYEPQIVTLKNARQTKSGTVGTAMVNENTGSYKVTDFLAQASFIPRNISPVTVRQGDFVRTIDEHGGLSLGFNSWGLVIELDNYNARVLGTDGVNRTFRRHCVLAVDLTRYEFFSNKQLYYVARYNPLTQALLAKPRTFNTQDDFTNLDNRSEPQADGTFPLELENFRTWDWVPRDQVYFGNGPIFDLKKRQWIGTNCLIKLGVRGSALIIDRGNSAQTKLNYIHFSELMEDQIRPRYFLRFFSDAPFLLVRTDEKNHIVDNRNLSLRNLTSLDGSFFIIQTDDQSVETKELIPLENTSQSDWMAKNPPIWLKEGMVYPIGTHQGAKVAHFLTGGHVELLSGEVVPVSRLESNESCGETLLRLQNTLGENQ